jgi:hypothetical protein
LSFRVAARSNRVKPGFGSAISISEFLYAAASGQNLLLKDIGSGYLNLRFLSKVSMAANAAFLDVAWETGIAVNSSLTRELLFGIAASNTITPDLISQ